MASPEVTRLIKFVQNDSSAISGKDKFTLTAPILREVNTLIQSVKNDLFVSKITTSDLINKYSNNDDLLFLYDFIKKTPKLKITNSNTNPNVTVDISDFASLTYLELHRINIKDVKGVHNLRSSLESVWCYRCLQKLQELLLNPCTAEKLTSCMWSKLKCLGVSRNNLSSIDESFIHTPWLQYLDLSYNQLSDIKLLTCLRHLTHLNVSYNHITEIPKFAMFKLKVLILNNNYITDISGVATLDSLQECNISDNCLSEHASLLPLAELGSLRNLKLMRNPLSYHPTHRSLTCGYLHEKILSQHFLLDEVPINNAEREFIRYSSRPIVYSYPRPSPIRNFETSSISSYDHSSVGKSSKTKIIRDVILDEQPVSEHDDITSSISYNEPDDYESDLQKKLLEKRKKDGPAYWLIPNYSSANDKNEFENLIPHFGDEIEEPFISTSPIPTSSTPNLNLPIGKLNQDEESQIHDPELIILSSETTTSEVKTDGKKNDEDETVILNESEEESSDEEEDDLSSENLWVVEKISDDSADTIFLTLRDGELKEVDSVTQKVITKWSIDCIERYTKISTEPLILTMFFEAAKRENRKRKYSMEFADAKVLMGHIDRELEARCIENQIFLRCMKCDFLFCHEKPKWKTIDEKVVPYKCTNCHSEAVIEEDSACVKNEKPISNSNTPVKSSTENVESNNENEDSSHDSDIEVISNQSESSVEVISTESNQNKNHKTMAQRLSEKLSNSGISSSDMVSVQAAFNQVLTESSSSGSMTDSSCTTTIETNYYFPKGPRPIDGILPEETSREVSPQQNNYMVDSSNNKNNNSELILPEIAPSFEELLSDVISTTAARKLMSNQSCTFEYSFTNFSRVDYRLKLFLWEEVIPDNEEILAFVKASAIFKSNQLGICFPGFVAVTSKKIYIVEITSKEDDEDYSSWLQKNDSIGAERIKLVEPILWKQGVCIHTDEKTIDGNSKIFLLLFNDEKRTKSYLTAIRDLGLFHVQKNENDDLETCPPIDLISDENVGNLTATNRISVLINNTELHIYEFVTLLTTNERLIIFKNELDWLMPKSNICPTILLEEIMTNLLDVTVNEEGIELSFVDEIEDKKMVWRIVTVCLDVTQKIITSIQEPWKELFDVDLPIKAVSC